MVNKSRISESIYILIFLSATIIVLFSFVMMLFSAPKPPQYNELMLMSFNGDNKPVLLLDDTDLEEIHLNYWAVLIGETSSRLTQEFKENLNEILKHNTHRGIFFIDIDLEEIESLEFQMLMNGLEVRGTPVLILTGYEQGLFHYYYFDGIEICDMVAWLNEITRTDAQPWRMRSCTVNR